ncbi:MAG: oxygen-binding di-iron domain-containing protein [Thermoanaerobaculia bacterium]
MGVTNSQSGTRVDEVSSGIFRINTPETAVPGGFSFNQYLVVDDAPLLFHTGSRRLFPLVREAIQSVMPIDRLRYIAFSHFESDECGSVNELLAAAPHAEPLCGRVNGIINADAFDRPPHVLADDEALSIGTRRLRWFDTPHLPHAWECGYLMEEHTHTLLCGDLFTQGGSETPALTTKDILGPSEAFRAQMDYFSHTRLARPMLERLAALAPTTLACMHGSAWQGDCAAMLRALASALDG